MNENDLHRTPRTRRSGLFWPLILIGIGVIFLLQNTGVLTGDMWNTLIPFWPVLLIIMGLDGVFRREGLVGATLVIGLGVVFLMNNLGYLTLNVWEVLIRLWPLFLVAAGIDILVGRRSRIGALLGLLVILVFLFGAVWAISGGNFGFQPLRTDQIQQPLEAAAQASIQINPSAGVLQVNQASDPSLLLDGRVPASKNISINSNFEIQDNKATFVLKDTGAQAWFPSDATTGIWDVALNPQIPLDLAFNMGAGRMDLDLRNLNVRAISINQGVGQVNLSLPQMAALNVDISGGVGAILVDLPSDVGVRIQTGTALVLVNVPAGYTKQGRSYTSPGYDAAQIKMQININLGVGIVTFRTQ